MKKMSDKFSNPFKHIGNLDSVVIGKQSFLVVLKRIAFFFTQKKNFKMVKQDLEMIQILFMLLRKSIEHSTAWILSPSTPQQLFKFNFILSF